MAAPFQSPPPMLRTSSTIASLLLATPEHAQHLGSPPGAPMRTRYGNLLVPSVTRGRQLDFSAVKDSSSDENSSDSSSSDDDDDEHTQAQMERQLQAQHMQTQLERQLQAEIESQEKALEQLATEKAKQAQIRNAEEMAKNERILRLLAQKDDYDALVHGPTPEQLNRYLHPEKPRFPHLFARVFKYSAWLIDTASTKDEKEVNAAHLIAMQKFFESPNVKQVQVEELYADSSSEIDLRPFGESITHNLVYAQPGDVVEFIFQTLLSPNTPVNHRKVLVVNFDELAK